jgi:hypothetical protein
MAHAGGRPSDYDPSFVDEVDKYLSTTGKEQTELPTIAGFAIYLGVTKKTLYNWCEKHPEFLHALDTILTHQEKQLIDDGIYGGKEVNATIVKLLLQNNHGMRERTDMTTNDKDIPAPIYGGKSTDNT